MIDSRLVELFSDHLAIVARRAARALEITGYEGLLIHSGTPLVAFLDDQTYPFRAHPPFKVWVPLADVPDCFVYFRPGAKPVLLFHSPEDYWHKPSRPPTAYWTAQFDIVPVADLNAARRALPGDLSRVAALGEPWAGSSDWNLAAFNPPALLFRLDFDRATKTPYELECLREANRIAVRGHIAAAEAFAAGASEFEIELAYLEACSAREQDMPYNPIVALNEGGAILHYQMLEREVPDERRSLLIDAGAQYGGYASDITRTYSHESADFAAIIDKLDEVQLSLCAGVRAGIDWRDMHLTAHRLIAELLREADVIRSDAEEAVQSGLSSVFFPHGLGHLLGLQVHDVGGTLAGPAGGEIARPEGHPYLRLTRVLEPHTVVTMEPGIYFIDMLLAQARGNEHGRHINWSRVESLRPFGGIRIEDDLAVTESGAENFTRDAFQQATRILD